MRTKVIGVDAWTKGIHHYARLVNAFNAMGLELSLIHLGSWGNEQGRAVEETIGDLKVRDISFYGRRGLDAMLEAESPAAVVFMSTDSFAHRAVNRYCARRAVPTVHVFHGLHGCVNVEDNVAVEVSRRLWLLRSHLRKQLLHYLPTYVRSLWETDADAREWRRFFWDVTGRFIGRYVNVAASDSRTNHACVYIDSEIEYAMARYGYGPGQVTPVGNPDLLLFGLPQESIGMFLDRPSIANVDVIYVDSGLLDVGFVYHSADEFVRHVLGTRDSLERQGKRLVYKPHPAHTGSPVLEAIANAGISICTQDNFVSRLTYCCAAIIEPSSAGLLPALLGLPVFFAQYGRCGDERFGELLTSYPRSRRLRHLSDFTLLLTDESAEVDVKQTRDWIDQHAGPMPSEGMPDRVARVVASLIDKAREESHGSK